MYDVKTIEGVVERRDLQTFVKFYITNIRV